MTKNSKSDTKTLLRGLMKKAQLSSHAVNNAIAYSKNIKKWVATVAAIKTAMRQQANANYKKAQDKANKAASDYYTKSHSMSTFDEVSRYKRNMKNAKNELKKLEKRRK